MFTQAKISIKKGCNPFVPIRRTIYQFAEMFKIPAKIRLFESKHKLNYKYALKT